MVNIFDFIILHNCDVCCFVFFKYDSKLNESLASEINVMLSTLGNPNMIEVKGVEERLSRLEQMMIKAKDSYDDIVNSTQVSSSHITHPALSIYSAYLIYIHCESAQVSSLFITALMHHLNSNVSVL